MNLNDTGDQHLIAVLEDDIAIRTMLQRILGRQYELVMVDNGAQLLQLLHHRHVSVILLDILLPGEDGIEIAKKVRTLSQVAVILISGISSSEIIATGLNVGADDYITKPFDPLVLRARVNNAIRRQVPAPLPGPRAIRIEGCLVDPLKRTIINPRGEQERLTEKEMQLLMALIERPAGTVSRDELSRKLTGLDSSPIHRALDVHVSNLRRKLQAITGIETILGSVRGKGYMLQSSVEIDSKH